MSQSRSFAFRSIPAAVLCAALALPREAAAQTHEGAAPAPAAEGHPGGHGGEGHGEEAGEHEFAEHSWHAGVTGALIGGFESGASRASEGVGLFIEYGVIENWLEIELGAHLIFAGEEQEVPIDLIFKIPFHLTARIHPFLGLGPTVVPVFSPGHSTLHYGGLAEVGSYFWVTDRFGITAQVAYNLLGGGEHIVNEIQGDVGVVFGW